MPTKLQLQINSKAIKDDTRGLAQHGILMTPAIGEDFWLYRVAVSETQAIVGFPKFGVIGVGFQKETDWNTNLPTACEPIEIYNHIKRNKGDSKIPRQRCIDAINLINNAVIEAKRVETIENLTQSTTDAQRLRVLSRFLRQTGNHEIAQTFDQLPHLRA